MSTLVIVPCGRKKIWSDVPEAGAIAAQDAYIGGPFRMNRAYAERFGDAWVILSAKYGFLLPDALIPGPYEVTFKRRSTSPISTSELQQQVRGQHLDRFDVVVGLGGKEYRAAIEASFSSTDVALVFPFTGLPLGKSLQATKRAIQTGVPGFAAYRSR